MAAAKVGDLAIQGSGVKASAADGAIVELSTAGYRFARVSGTSSGAGSLLSIRPTSENGRPMIPDDQQATADEKAVLAVLQAVLEAMTARDEAVMRSLFTPTGWAVHSRDGRVFHERLWDLPDRLPDPGSRVEERVYDPLVRVDDDIAMIWCAYDVLHDGRPHHWGTNIVSLMRSGGRWRVCGITDNGRSGARPLG